MNPTTTTTTPQAAPAVPAIVDTLFTILAAAFAGRPLISFAIAEVHQLVDDGILAKVTATVTPPAAS